MMGSCRTLRKLFFFWGRRLGAKEKKESARPKIAERPDQQAALTGLQSTVQPKKMIDKWSLRTRNGHRCARSSRICSQARTRRVVFAGLRVAGCEESECERVRARRPSMRETRWLFSAGWPCRCRCKCCQCVPLCPFRVSGNYIVPRQVRSTGYGVP